MLVKFKSLGSYDGSVWWDTPIIEHTRNDIYKILNKEIFFLIVIKYGVEYEKV